MARLALTDLSIRALKPDARADFWDAKFPTFGIRVGPRSKTFIVKVEGGRRAIGTYPEMSLQDARKKALLYKAQPPKPRSDIKFAQAYDAFRELHCSQKKARTARDYAYVIERHFLPKLGSRRLEDVDHTDVAKITDKLIKTPSERSHAIAVARTFWKFCVSRRYVAASPLDGVQLPKAVARDRVLSDSELKAVWLACDAAEAGGQPLSPTYASIVKVLILTGSRKMEVGSLRRSWLTRTHIEYPASIMKNGRPHRLPIGPLLRSVLDAVPKTGDLLFPARGKDTPFNGWSKSLEALKARSGVDGFTAHDLRRTWSSMNARWAPPHVLERALSHSSGQISGVAAIYNRYSYEKELVECYSRWEKYLQDMCYHELVPQDD